MLIQKFSDKDKHYMQLAIEEAEKAVKKGNYPCGAVLVVNDQIIDKGHNLKESSNDRISHAEMLLYIRNSSLLKASKKENARITIYTTLEPCLMCFGAACIHRVDRVVVSSPDPYGSMTKLDFKKIGSFYKENVPKIEYGLYFEKTFNLTREYLLSKKDNESQNLIQLLSELRYINSE